MGWFSKPEVEVRADSSYTDTLVNLIVSQAGGSIVKATATAALEAAAGVVARAFAAAEVSGPPLLVDAFGPAVRSMVGRSLIRSGEIVLAVDVRGGAVHFVPAADWDIQGGYAPETWRYRLSLAGPSQQFTRSGVGADQVVHFRYQVDPAMPWKGVGPLESAALAGRLSAELANALGDEASGTRGHLLPIPVDGQDPTITALKADLKTLRGRLAVVESQTTGKWTADNRQAARGGWTVERLGANPPEPLVMLHEIATRDVLSACGVSPALFGGADGTSAREAWRLALHGVIAPLADLVVGEISEKTGEQMSINFDKLRASDVSGRARAFQSLTGGGLSVGSAAVLAGFEGAEAAEVAEVDDGPPEPQEGEEVDDGNTPPRSRSQEGESDA